jgi:tetratricopeptide (TPR) repeat protein
VADAASGKLVDLARERFGFRETWLQGDQIYFNGHPIKYNGVCNGPAFSNRCESSMTRNTMSIDMSDETGGPATIQVSGLTNTPSKHNVDRDQFWQATQADAEAVIRRNWNHPCLVAWDLSNEWHHYAPYSGADMALCSKRFKALTIGSGAKAIIVLASDSKPGKDKMPWDVTIPVGQQVEGFCFLHSVAYTGGQAGRYQVQYADGTTAEISLKIDENIRDWTDKNTEEFPHEKGTKSYIAWTGTCKMFGQIGIYMMRWVNLRPEVPVIAVRFSNPGRDAVPVLLGLTAAVKKDAKAAEAALAKAQDLLKKARDAMDANKKDDAKSLLQQAVAAWPALTAAHEALADLAEQSGSEDQMLEVYRRWTGSGARTPVPWNRLGAILEKRKDYKGALEAYNQSLKVEWNQPPTIEAKARMEKLLNEK